MPIQNDFGKFLGLSADEIQKVNNIPGLDAAIYKSYNNSPPNSAIPRTKIIAKSALTDPVAFVKKNIQDYSSTYVEDTAFKDTTNADKDLAIIKSSYQYLQTNGVSAEDAQKLIDTGVSTGNQRVQSLQESSKSSDFMDVVAPIALAFVAPQLGAALAVDLGISAAAGTVIASTALQVAAGADPTKALENAVTTAAVQTGSVAVAKEVNTALSTAGQSAEVAAQIKDISNAAGSAIASAAMTAARGGSQQDIIDSAVAGAAGSAATTAATIQDIPTPEAKAIGGAVAGALTGGTQGALTSAAAALGGATAAEKDSAPVAKPEEVSSTGVAPTTDTSQQAADLGDVTVTGSRQPDLTIPAASDLGRVTVTAPKYQPEITTPSYTPSTSGAAEQNLGQVSVTAPKYEPDITTASYIPSTSGVRGDLGKVVVTGSRYEPDITSPVAPISESQPEVPVEDRTGTPVDQTAGYEPSLTTASKVSRTGGASVTGPSSTLARALQGDFYPTSTTGLTAYRPAGEIESEETGKQRQDVWNEASLRLKDALGI